MPLRAEARLRRNAARMHPFPSLCELAVEERSAVNPLKPRVYSGPPPDLAEPAVTRSKLMVSEPLRGVVAHAKFRRHNAERLAAILHGGVTLQTAYVAQPFLLQR
jgi:hypothetical protein